jgi:hypothetical protein
VQIKDRVSSGGAERIYAALLGDRRHRSPRSRCAVLEFLAQCLRSVDPSARRVRELTRELVGQLLAAYPDGDGAWGTAVCALFADGDAERDIIAAEVDAVTAEMISSDDPNARIAGLQFAIAMTDVSFYRKYWDYAPWDFWQAREAANLQRYTVALATAAEADTYLRYRALDAKIITSRQALTMADGLSSLFEQTGSFFSTISYPPRLDDVFQAMLSGWPAFGAASVADDLAAVGEYLITHETAPWVSSAVGWWGDLPNDDLDDLAPRPAVRPVKLSQDARLGAVAFITIATEAGFLAQLSKGNRRKLGPLSNLRPYLARRCGSRSTAELPDLPVPDEFKPIFREWADGRIDLIA